MRRADPRFLCETCGYDLTGQWSDEVCPECGRRVGSSSAAHRTGSPWQRRPGPVSLVRTLVLVALSPRTCWDRFIPEVRRSAALLAVTAAAGAVLPAASLAIERWSGVRPRPSYLVVFFVTSWLLMVSMSLVEYVGIRFFGGRRGWRIDERVAACVVSHAAVGWVALGALAAVGWQVANILARDGTIKMRYTVAGTPVHSAGLILAGTLVAGILVYELIVYNGVRRMRFANSSDGDGPTAAPPEAGGDA